MAVNTEQEKDVLRKLNQLIRDAEFNHRDEDIAAILDDGLVFQRASGAIVGKKQYLDQLKDPGNVYDLLEITDIKINLDEAGIRAVAVVMINATGHRGKEQQPFAGNFKNIRFFRKAGDWKLVAWYNEGTLAVNPQS